MSLKYSLNLGSMPKSLARRSTSGSQVFRLAVLGDFSGRASGGQLATGAELAKRKPLTVDIDNLDDMVRRLKIKLTLPIGEGGGAVEIPLNSMDDFHPDQLYENVEIFSGLAGLRQRLKTTSTFAKAAQEVQSWLGDKVEVAEPPPARPRGSAIPVNGKLSDFAQLLGQPTVSVAQTQLDDLLKQIVAPYLVPAKDPKQDKLVATVDQAVSQTMLRILHHPDFQALESIWRGLEFLIRRLETSTTFKIVVYDISAEEFAADLSSTQTLEDTGLYSLLVEQPAVDAQNGPPSAIVTNYCFEQTPPHAELLGRAARIAAAAQAPLLAAIGLDVLKKVRPEEVHPLILESWSALKSLPESAYLGLTVPRFMLRMPYGADTDPIDRFDFEEFTPREGLRGMLYASGAILAGLLLGESFIKGDGKIKLGSIMSAGDMPYYYYEDADGDKVGLPCTERLLSVDLASHVTAQRFMPVLSIKGRPEVRLGSFQSLAGKQLAGFWAPVTVGPAAPAAASSPPTGAAAEPAPAASGVVETPAASSQAEAAAADAELDALLASLAAPAESAAPAGVAEGDAELDPALAALLADL